MQTSTAVGKGSKDGAGGTAKASAKPQARAKRPFGWRDLFGYFLGDFGGNMSFTLINTYMFIFFTQFVGLSLAHYAIIILIAKINDGINDPIIGIIVDKMGVNKKGDKYKHWILIGAPLLSLSAVLMFLNISSWPYGVKLFWCIITYVFWDVMYTIVNVPYGTLASAMTDDPAQRGHLSVVRTWGGVGAGIPLGVIIPLVTYVTITNADGTTSSIFQGDRMWWIAVILGLVAIACFTGLYFNVEERVEHVEPEEEVKVNYFKTLKDFFTNRAILGISLASVALILFCDSAVQLHQLCYQLYFHNGAFSALAIFFKVAPLVTGTVIGSALVNRCGKRELTSWPALAAAAVYLFLLFAPIHDAMVWSIIQIVGNSFGFGILVYTWAFVSEGIEYQDYKTGTCNEASTYATYNMFRKFGSGLGQFLIPLAIAIFIPTLNVADPSTWTEANAFAIRNLSVIFPMIGYILIFVIMQFIYPLSRDKAIEMETALRKKRGEE